MPAVLCLCVRAVVTDPSVSKAHSKLLGFLLDEMCEIITESCCYVLETVMSLIVCDC